MPNFIRHCSGRAEKFLNLGDLTLTTQTILITDPYDDKPSTTTKFRVMKGEWEAEVKLLYSTEVPIAKIEWIVLMHKDYVDNKNISGKWKNLYKINIESGFCCISENKFYKNDKVSNYDSRYDVDENYMNPGDKWLWMCDKILHRRPVAGLIPHGAFCETGDGDGTYKVSVQKEAGEITGIRIRFLQSKTMLHYLRRKEIKHRYPPKKTGRKPKIRFTEF